MGHRRDPGGGVAYRNTASDILASVGAVAAGAAGGRRDHNKRLGFPATMRDEALLRTCRSSGSAFWPCLFEKDRKRGTADRVGDDTQPAAAADVWRLLESADAAGHFRCCGRFRCLPLLSPIGLAAHDDDSSTMKGFGRVSQVGVGAARNSRVQVDGVQDRTAPACHRAIDGTDIAKRTPTVKIADEIATATRRANTIAELVRRQ